MYRRRSGPLGVVEDVSESGHFRSPARGAPCRQCANTSSERLAGIFRVIVRHRDHHAAFALPTDEDRTNDTVFVQIDHNATPLRFRVYALPGAVWAFYESWMLRLEISLKTEGIRHFGRHEAQ